LLTNSRSPPRIFNKNYGRRTTIPQQVAPLGEQNVAPAEIGGNDGNVVNAPQENLEVIF
jgi:hypothetical protein